MRPFQCLSFLCDRRRLESKRGSGRTISWGRTILRCGLLEERIALIRTLLGRTASTLWSWINRPRH